MKKGLLPVLVLMLSCPCCFAGFTDIAIDKGSVLVYQVKEGNKAYLYTVTIQEWDSKANTSFLWQTNEKPKSRKGVCNLDLYYSLYANELVIGIGKTGSQQLGKRETSIIAPATLNDLLIEETIDADFSISENSNGYSTTYNYSID